jgi:hypothetical protein
VTVLSAEFHDDRSEFKIAPEYRRCLFYGIAGFVLLAATAWWVQSTIRPEQTRVPVLVFVLFAVATFWPLSWRLELDGDGLVRHRLGLADRWSWEDFANGRIQKRYPFNLVDPARPWWSRKLNLQYLDTNHRNRVLAALNQHYRFAETPRVDELTIKYSLRKTATFGRHGLQVIDRGQRHDYRWADVRHLHILRTEAVRQDFRELNLMLPDREIGLRMVAHQGGTSPTWHKATAEQVNDFLLTHVPQQHISVDIVGERPHHPTDIERDLRRLQSEYWQLKICMSVLAVASAGSLLWLAIEGPPIRTLVMTIPFLLLALLFAFVRKQHHDEVTKRQHWLSELSARRAHA